MMLLNDYKIEQEQKRDILNGLNLLKSKCIENLNKLTTTENLIDSDLTEYFKLKIFKVSEHIKKLENEILTDSFDKYVIKQRILKIANSNFKEVAND